VRVDANVLSFCGSLADLHRGISVTREGFDSDLRRILSELEKITEKRKEPSQKRRPDRRACAGGLIEWVAVKWISIRSINHPLFREMVQLVNLDLGQRTLS
jgi:hypothetical protein